MKPIIDKRLAETPIGDLAIKPHIYYRLCGLGVRVVGDLFELSEADLAPDIKQLVIAIERLKKNSRR